MGRGDLAKAMKAAEKHKELTKVGYLLPFKVFQKCLLNVEKMKRSEFGDRC